MPGRKRRILGWTLAVASTAIATGVVVSAWRPWSVAVRIVERYATVSMNSGDAHLGWMPPFLPGKAPRFDFSTLANPAPKLRLWLATGAQDYVWPRDLGGSVFTLPKVGGVWYLDSRRTSTTPLAFIGCGVFVIGWPIPFGLAGLSYALIRSANRARRVRAGTCAACGYNLAALATCPECGSRRGAEDQTAALGR